MLSRTKRALVDEKEWVVLHAVLPVTFATCVKFVPSLLTSRLKSRVLKLSDSSPAQAWRTTIRSIVWIDPRSTCKKRVTAFEHHLSPLPPVMLPLTALSAVSVVAHAALPVAVFASARLGGSGDRKPKTESMFENEAKYTLPLAMTGGLNLANFSVSSAGAVLDQSKLRLLASYARTMPGTTAWFALPRRGVVAQTIPLPEVEPLADTASMPPGIPSGGSTDPTEEAGVLNVCAVGSNR